MIKCVVWDLDDTVWHGTLRNGDALMLNPDAARVMKLAEERGVMQSIVSRNKAEPALAQLTAFGVMRYFLYPRIEEYIEKADAVRDIAVHFNIGLDSVAFVDDNPFEIYTVNRYLPSVFTFTTDEITLLEEQIQNLPPQTANRNAWMRRREARMQAEQAFTGTRDEFLKECRMTLCIRPARKADIPRISELASRTHQINSAMLSPEAVDFDEYLRGGDLYVCELDDIFGYHGVVGAGLFSREETVLRIDLFCVSCRVDGRGVALAFLGETLRHLTRAEPSLTSAVCRCREYKQGSAFLLLKSLGFEVVGLSGQDVETRLTLPLTPTDRPTGVPWLTIRFAADDD